MKCAQLFLLTLLLAGSMAATTAYANSSSDNSAPRTEYDAWNIIYPSIEERISDPVFPDARYDISDFGAKANDSGFLNHHAINAAIDKCSGGGGGAVVVPKGVWHTGPVRLKSNVNLHLEEGAILLFSSDLSQYPLVLTRWEGMDCYNYQPMIYAYDETNVAVTGKGVIDGGATNDDWWRMCGSPRYGWKEGVVSQKTGRPLLMQWNKEKVPVEERRMGDGFGMRTQLVNFHSCKNVLMEGVTLLRSPFWVIHPLLCENVTMRGLHIENDGPNGDGCDPESCKDVLIEDCYFDTGDDCIAIKSGRNNDGRRWSVPSENIIVRNCQMKNGHGGVVIGSEISGGFRNLFVENCVMDSPELDRVIRIKTNTCRGGVVEDVFVRNVEVGQCREAVLKINLLYEPREADDRGFVPVVRNVWLNNVTCEKSRYGVMIVGLDEGPCVYNINVTDCNFTGVQSDGNSISGLTRDVRLTNLSINGQPYVDDSPLSREP